MKRKNLKVEIISAVTVLVIIGVAILFFELSTQDGDSRNPKRTGNNDIDKYIQTIYENDDFLSEYKPNYANSDNELPIGNFVNYDLFTLEYEGNNYYNKYGFIRKSYLGEKIETEKNIYDKSGEVELELYSIKGISTDVAIGICGKNSEIKHIFLNDNYEADNMMELMQDCGFEYGATVQYCSLSDYEGKYSIWYQGITMEKLQEVLFEDSESMVVKEYDSSIEETGMTFRIYVDRINCYFLINVLENGYIKVKFMDLARQWVFSNENGIEKGIELIDYIRENYKGAL